MLREENTLKEQQKEQLKVRRTLPRDRRDRNRDLRDSSRELRLDRQEENGRQNGKLGARSDDNTEELNNNSNNNNNNNNNSLRFRSARQSPLLDAVGPNLETVGGNPLNGITAAALKALGGIPRFVISVLSSLYLLMF